MNEQRMTVWEKWKPKNTCVPTLSLSRGDQVHDTLARRHVRNLRRAHKKVILFIVKKVRIIRTEHSSKNTGADYVDDEAAATAKAYTCVSMTYIMWKSPRTSRFVPPNEVWMQRSSRVRMLRVMYHATDAITWRVISWSLLERNCASHRVFHRAENIVFFFHAHDSQPYDWIISPTNKCSQKPLNMQDENLKCTYCSVF